MALDAGPGPPGRLYRLFDAALDAINRPFAWLTPSARQVVGLLAIVTIAVSIAAMLGLPRLYPRRDAVSFLNEKRAGLVSSIAGGQTQK